MRADHLGRHQRGDAVGAGQPHAREDRRQRGRQHHLEEDEAARRAHRQGRVHQQPVYLLHAAHRAQQHRPERRPENDRHLRQLADAQEQDEHRKQREGRGLAKQLQHRVDDGRQPLEAADQQSQHHARAAGQHQPPQRSLQAGRHVFPQLVVVDQLGDGCQHRRRRAQVGVAHDAQARQRFPQQQEQHDADAAFGPPERAACELEEAAGPADLGGFEDGAH